MDKNEAFDFLKSYIIEQPVFRYLHYAHNLLVDFEEGVDIDQGNSKNSLEDFADMWADIIVENCFDTEDKFEEDSYISPWSNKNIRFYLIEGCILEILEAIEPLAEHLFESKYDPD